MDGLFALALLVLWIYGVMCSWKSGFSQAPLGFSGGPEDLLVTAQIEREKGFSQHPLGFSGGPENLLLTAQIEREKELTNRLAN